MEIIRNKVYSYFTNIASEINEAIIVLGKIKKLFFICAINLLSMKSEQPELNKIKSIKITKE